MKLPRSPLASLAASALLTLLSPSFAQEATPESNPEATPGAEAAEAAEPAPAPLLGENLPEQTGKVSSVTLYQGTALVSREVEIPADSAGIFEVVVAPLPSATNPASVYADNAQGVSVRSVVCRRRPFDEQEALDTQVGQLDEEIRELEKTITTNRNEIALRRIRQEYLRGLENFVGPAVDAEMKNGVLQADQLETITQMHFREYETASQEIMQLDFKNDELSRELQRKRQQRSRLASGPPVQYDAVILVEKETGQAASLQLNYLVTDCGWTPLYSLRAQSGAEQVELEFNALISQASGEDWDDVALTLSTAQPISSAFNPRLAAMAVSLRGDNPMLSRSMAPNEEVLMESQTELAQAQLMRQRERAKTRLMENQSRQNDLKSAEEQAGNMFETNRIADELQILELEALPTGMTQNREEPSVEYALQRRVKLVSRRDAQVVPVLERTLPAEFYHVAVPVLTESVYREALLTNDGDTDLLGGQVQVYLDERFVGRTEMPMIARARSYPIGFGVDGQLRARRTLEDRTDTVQGGNQQIRLEVGVAIDHFGAEPVKLRLRERMPWMQDDASLRVKLEQAGLPLSTDAEYLATEKERNILLWEVEVKPGVGEAATAWAYEYSLEFDRNMSLTQATQNEVNALLEGFINRSLNAKPSKAKGKFSK